MSESFPCASQSIYVSHHAQVAIRFLEIAQIAKHVKLILHININKRHETQPHPSLWTCRWLYGIKQSSLTAIASVLTQRNVCKIDHDWNKLQLSYTQLRCVIYFQPILKKQLYKLDAQKIIIINAYVDMNKEMLLIDTYLKTNLNGLGMKSRNCKHIE